MRINGKYALQNVVKLSLASQGDLGSETDWLISQRLCGVMPTARFPVQSKPIILPTSTNGLKILVRYLSTDHSNGPAMR